MRPTAVALRRARRFADSLGDLASREKSGGKIARAVGTSPVFKFSSDGSSAGGCSLGAFHRARESATRGGERARGTRRDIARGTETSRAHTRTRGRRAETRCARARTSRASASNLFSIPATRKTRCDFYRPRARDSARRVAARARDAPPSRRIARGGPRVSDLRVSSRFAARSEAVARALDPCSDRPTRIAEKLRRRPPKAGAARGANPALDASRDASARERRPFASFPRVAAATRASPSRCSLVVPPRAPPRAGVRSLSCPRALFAGDNLARLR